MNENIIVGTKFSKNIKSIIDSYVILEFVSSVKVRIC